MSDETIARHLPPDALWSEVFVEEFDAFVVGPGTGWRVVGSPSLEPLQFDARSGIEVTAPGDRFRMCRLERDLDAPLLAGRSMRVDLNLLIRSTPHAEAMDGIRISLLAAGADQTPHAVVLPLVPGIAPAWETQSFILDVGPDVQTMSVRIDVLKPDAGVRLDRIGVSARSREAGATPPGVNRLRNGSFETGQTTFTASGVRTCPNGEEQITPLQWDLTSDAVVGAAAFRCQISDAAANIALEPVDLRHVGGSSGDRAIHVSFHARAERSTTATCLLRSPQGVLAEADFALDAEWKPYRFQFAFDANPRLKASSRQAVELAFRFARGDSSKPNVCLLDAVALTDRPVEGAYSWPSEVEVGIVGPASYPGDLSQLVIQGEETRFLVRMVTPVADRLINATSDEVAAEEQEFGRPLGVLAIDLLDVYDRPVFSRTVTPLLSPQGWAFEMVRAALPRGAYRLLATLWSKEPGTSRIIDQADQPVVVINAGQPVPRRNYFGLSASGSTVSRFTTHLGVGWVKARLKAQQLRNPAGQWDMTGWEQIIAACYEARTELLIELDAPTDPAAFDAFLERWELPSSETLIGVAPVSDGDPPALNDDYLHNLKRLEANLAQRPDPVRVVADYSVIDSVSHASDASGPPVEQVIGFAGMRLSWPEANEPTLETIRQFKPADRALWDLAVPVLMPGSETRLSAPALGPAGETTSADDVLTLRTDAVDPVRAASHMVRSALIRLLAGAEMICWDATALAPQASWFEPADRRLHHEDFSPKPAIAALDVMASLLNDATLHRWLDLVGGARVLLFHKDDGAGVAAVWRPFGRSATHISLGSRIDNALLMDCLGRREQLVTHNDESVMIADEIVRFIAIPAEHRTSFNNGLSNMRVLPDLPETTSQPTSPETDQSDQQDETRQSEQETEAN